MSYYYVSSGVTSTGVDLSYGSMFVLSGGVANDTTTTNGGMLYVSSGGLANSTTVNEHGHLIVYFGGEVNSTTVTEWEGYFSVNSGGVANNTTLSKGYLDIYSGGVANGITVISGSLRVCSGGTATDVDWTPCVGYITVEPGASVTFASEYTGVYYGSDNQLLASGLVWDPVTMPLTGDCRLCIMNGGVAEGVTNGSIEVYSGGVASNISDGSLLVGSGGVADGVTVNTHGGPSVGSGGTINRVTLNSGGSLELHEGGVANSVTVNSKCFVNIYGGTANSVTVNVGGSIYVGSGGTATNIVWTPCEGRVRVRNGGYATFASEYSGVYYGSGGKMLENAAAVYGMTLPSACEMYVMSEGVADSTTVNSAGFMQVSGGSADHTTVNSSGRMEIISGNVSNTTVNSGGSLYVRSSGTVNDTTVNYSGRLVIESGGVASDTTLSGGEYRYHSGLLEVYSGGTANGVVINPKCVLEVSSGGTATNVDWTPCEGHVWGDVTFVSQYSGVYYGEHNELLSNTAVMDGKTLYDDYEMYVMDGGTANHTILSSGGSLWISSGGVANDTNVYSRGYLYAYGGGVANSTTVNHEAWMFVYSGGTANSTTLSGISGAWGKEGMLYLHSGGIANDTMVNSYGNLVIYDGGVASNVTVKANGKLMLGGKLTGRMTFEYGAVISGWNYEEGILDFDISDIAPSNTALVNDLSCIQVMPRFTLTVSGAETTGSYRLVGYAADFNETITVVNTSGVELGTLAVADGTKEIGGVKYALTLNKENVLSVMVGEIDPNVFTGELTSATKEITAGSSALCVDVNISGLLKVLDGGTANYTTVNSGGTLYVSKGGVANYTTLNCNYDDDGFTVFEGGVASNTTVDYNGTMIVSAGGSAIDTTLLLSGRCIVYGVASNTVNSGGKLRISSGGVASNTTVVSSNGLYVYDDGMANETTVSSGAGLYVHGGVASNTTVHSSGELFIHSGGTAVGVTANASGAIGVEGVASNIIVNSGGGAGVTGTVRNVTISSGGMLHFGAAGKLTGKMTFENGAVVSSFENSFVDFDLTRTSIGAEALLNNLSAIAGETPLYTLTVGGGEAYGDYKLAEGAAGFNETITVVNTSGTKLGTLTVGNKAMAGGAAYTLNLTDGSLSVTVEEPENGPEEPLNNYLYDKKQDPVININVTEEYGTVLTSAGQEIRLDKIGTVDYGEEHYHNHVGKSTESSDADYTFDYAKIVLQHGAKLSFHAEATAAATFTVYSLTEKNGKYSLKKLQTLKLADKDKDGVFTADSSKPIQLQVSGPYYVSMQFKDKKAAEAYYNVTLKDASEFYPLGDNSDDWGDMKTAGYAGAVGDLGVINAASLEADETVIRDEWIGFGDKVDFKKFTLESAAELSLKVNAPDGPLKLTVCKLKETTKKDVTTYSQTNVKSVSVSAKQGTASLSSLQLEAGEYFFRVDSGDVKKSTGYSVQVTDSTFYTDGDNGWNNWLYDKKDNAVNEVMGSYVGTYSETWIDFDYDVNYDEYYNFVGFGDACDYSEIYVDEEGLYNFKIDTTGKAKFTVYSMTRNSKGKWTQKALGSHTINDVNGATGATLKKDVKLSATNEDLRYFVSMQAADTKKSPEVYYNVMSFPTAVSEADALSMPTDADALTMPAATATSLAELNDASGWQSLLA